MVKEKSPGRDGIEYKMIRLLAARFKEELLELYNDCFLNRKMFEDWKKVQTIFIDKSNKEKVRPIAMTSCVGKVLERMITERLIWWTEWKNII